MKENNEIPSDPEQRIADIASCEFAIKNGMKIVSMNPDEVRVSMDLKGKLNGFDTGHGGAIFCLADQAFPLMVNGGKEPQVAMSASIRYLKPATGPFLATARKVIEDDRTSTCNVDVIQDGQKVAEFEGIGYKLKKK